MTLYKYFKVPTTDDCEIIRMYFLNVYHEFSIYVNIVKQMLLLTLLHDEILKNGDCWFHIKIYDFKKSLHCSSIEKKYWDHLSSEIYMKWRYSNLVTH